MMDDFETAEIETGETSIFVRWSGAGPPILLLHGFPQTHLMWRSVAPLLARSFTVVCADLRGYGRRLGYPRFSVAGGALDTWYVEARGPLSGRGPRRRHAAR
jgi:pimeloyl-ACP methyl ester carboxylesterase